MAVEFTVAQIISTLITILVVALFINWAAGIVTDRRSFGAALIVAVLGSVAAWLVYALLGAGVLGLILAIVVWSLIAAAAFRTRLVKGALIGVVAWILWVLVTLLVEWIVSQIQSS